MTIFYHSSLHVYIRYCADNSVCAKFYENAIREKSRARHDDHYPSVSMALPDFSIDSLDGFQPQEDSQDFFETTTNQHGYGRQDVEPLEEGGGRAGVNEITRRSSKDGAFTTTVDPHVHHQQHRQEDVMVGESSSVHEVVDEPSLLGDDENSLVGTNLRQMSTPPQVTKSSGKRQEYERCSSTSLSAPTTPNYDRDVGGTGSMSPWERWIIQKARQEREEREKRRISKVACFVSMETGSTHS